MNAARLAEAVLLWLGVVAELLCLLGFLTMRDEFDSLHYVSAAGTVGPALVVAALVVADGRTSSSVTAILTVMVLVIAGPAIVHATARAGRVWARGRWDPFDSERRVRP